MSKDNKSTRQTLEMIYGKGCMFRRAKIAERIEQLGGIKTYKRYIIEQRYTRRRMNKLERNLTYHHLQHRSEGGLTDIENGAEINQLAHQYIHSLSRSEEEIINNMLREYKQQFTLTGTLLIPTQNNLTLEQSFDIDLDFDSIGEDYISIPVFDTTKEDLDKRKKFNRAKIKQETRRLALDQIQEDDEYEL